MPRGTPVRRRNVDPVVAERRARKAGIAAHSPDAHIRALVRTAGKLTPEQMDQLRALLPVPADGGQS